jgi:hypothetical protein
MSCRQSCRSVLTSMWTFLPPVRDAQGQKRPERQPASRCGFARCNDYLDTSIFLLIEVLQQSYVINTSENLALQAFVPPLICCDCHDSLRWRRDNKLLHFLGKFRHKSLQIRLKSRTIPQKSALFSTPHPLTPALRSRTMTRGDHHVPLLDQRAAAVGTR